MALIRMVKEGKRDVVMPETAHGNINRWKEKGYKVEPLIPVSEAPKRKPGRPKKSQADFSGADSTKAGSVSVSSDGEG